MSHSDGFVMQNGSLFPFNVQVQDWHSDMASWICCGLSNILGALHTLISQLAGSSSLQYVHILTSLCPLDIF